MSKQTVNIGSAANDGTGDPIRTAFDKVNQNFTECYGLDPTMVSGRYIPTDPTRAPLGTSSTSGGAGRIRFTLFRVFSPITISGLSMYVVTTSGGNSSKAFQGCLYNLNPGSSNPIGTNLGYTETIASGVAGGFEGLFTNAGGSGSNITLTRGIYAAGVQYFDTSGAVAMWSNGSNSSAWLCGGQPTAPWPAASATLLPFGLRYTGTFGTFPDLTSTAPNLFGAAAGALEEPAIWLKLA